VEEKQFEKISSSLYDIIEELRDIKRAIRGLEDSVYNFNK
jgi:hypothetical protein